MTESGTGFMLQYDKQRADHQEEECYESIHVVIVYYAGNCRPTHVPVYFSYWLNMLTLGVLDRRHL